MNKNYIVRQAKKADKENILKFIRQYWSKEHIFLQDNHLFEYQHIFDEKNNFILGCDEEGKIRAILGYIQYQEEAKGAHAFLALWVADPKAEDSLIGTKLLDYITKLEFKTVSCVGIAKKVLPIYHLLGFKTGKLKQYYRLNSKKEVFKIAKIGEKNIIPILDKDTAQLTRIFDIGEDELSKIIQQGMHKDRWYLQHRYFNYPFYEYIVLGIYKEEVLKSLIVLREIQLEDAKVLRAIDYIGEIRYFAEVTGQIDQYLIDGEYEYIDFYQHGINSEVMNSCGFILNENKKNIIPNYFEPFVQQNVEITYATNTDENIFIFKGDGDQDRPNHI